MTKIVKSQKMPKFIPAPERIVSLFHENVDDLPNIELRKMFGYPCAFINGQMLTGVFADRIILRLSEEDRKKIINFEKTKLFEPVPGRQMKEYVELPEAIITSQTEFNRWLLCGLEYVKTLPPKEKKKKSEKASRRDLIKK